MSRYPHAPRFGRVVAADINYDTEPAPDWVKLDGWSVLGRVRGNDRPVYILQCRVCQHETRPQQGRLHRIVREGKPIRCAECLRRKTAGRNGPPKWCRTCGDNPGRRDANGCTECGKPYGEEFYGAAPSSLVGGQLAGLAEVCDG